MGAASLGFSVAVEGWTATGSLVGSTGAGVCGVAQEVIRSENRTNRNPNWVNNFLHIFPPKIMVYETNKKIVFVVRKLFGSPRFQRINCMLTCVTTGRAACQQNVAPGAKEDMSYRSYIIPLLKNDIMAGEVSVEVIHHTRANKNKLIRIN